MKKLIPSLVGILATITVAGCAANTTQTVKNTGQMQVTASFYPIYYFASQIGGDNANVTNLTPAGAEPHDYELTPQNIATIQDSRLLLLNGGQLEPWAEDVTADLPASTVVVEAAAGLTDRTIEEDGETITDPHVWLSPRLAKQEVQKITDGFIMSDPDHGTNYTANSQALQDRLDQLDTEYKNGLANCASKVIITSHAAFSYLASAYGLQQMPIAGLSPDAEPSLNKLAEIADFAKQHNVHYIFFESLISPKLAETLASEVGAQTLVLNPLEGLTDEEIAAGQDYFTVMQDNLTNLRTALQCQ